MWKKNYIGCLIFLAIFAMPSFASVQIMGTRVVYKEPSSEVDLQINNKDKAPALIQSWIDRGDPKVSPGQVKVPFVVTPPLARIEPNSGQTLRIFFTNSEELPKNKESLFWLNVLEIPHKPSKNLAKKNILQISIRSRFKLFYRPENLPGSAAEAPEKIKWHLKKDGTKQVLEAQNTTPFFVSLSKINLINSKGSTLSMFPITLPPGEILELKSDKKNTITSGLWSKVKYNAIGDYGDAIKGETFLSK